MRVGGQEALGSRQGWRGVDGGTFLKQREAGTWKTPLATALQLPPRPAPWGLRRVTIGGIHPHTLVQEILAAAHPGHTTLSLGAPRSSPTSPSVGAFHGPASHMVVLCKGEVSPQGPESLLCARLHGGAGVGGSMWPCLQGALIPKAAVTNQQRLCCDRVREGMRPGEVWGPVSQGWEAGQAMCIRPLRCPGCLPGPAPPASWAGPGPTAMLRSPRLRCAAWHWATA